MRTLIHLKQLLLASILTFCSFAVINTTNAQWTQIGSNIYSGTQNYFGHSVSLSGDGTTIAVGAPIENNIGVVRIYRNVVGTWIQYGADIGGEAVPNLSGFSVSLSADGNIVAIGAPANSGNGTFSGHVRIFKNIAGIWTQQGSDIDGEAEYNQSGSSVSLSSDGSTVAIGAPKNSGNGYHSGQVRIYKNISGTWTQVGADLDGRAGGVELGWTVSLSADGSIVATSAYNYTRIYQNIAGNWTQVGSDIELGRSASLSANGGTVAIGGGANSVKIYKNISGTWTQQGADIIGEATSDGSAYSVSLSADGTIVAIGAHNSHVRVFKYIGGSWTQLGANLDGQARYDQFGWVSLSASGNIVAIGTLFIHVRVYQLAPCIAPVSINLTLNNLKPFWAPATDPFTFYYGLVDAKRIDANVSGGVGPFIYTWTNTAGGQWLLPRHYYPANSIDLFRPLASTIVSVDVFDAGTGCTHTASVNINWDGQYHCNTPSNYWNIVICKNGVTMCVPWNDGKNMLKANPPTATLGACAPLKADPEAHVLSLRVYPNPSSGLLTLEMPIAANSKGTIEVMDINGRALYSESANMQEGVLYHTLDLAALPNGIYIVRIATDNEFATECIQIIR